MARALLAGTKTQTRRLVKSIELARGEARGVRVAPNTFCYLYATAGQPGSHRIVSALRAIEAWIREGGAL